MCAVVSMTPANFLPDGHCPAGLCLLQGSNTVLILSGTAPVHPESLLLGPPSTQGSDLIQNQNTLILPKFYNGVSLPGSQLLLETGEKKQKKKQENFTLNELVDPSRIPKHPLGDAYPNAQSFHVLW